MRHTLMNNQHERREGGRQQQHKNTAQTHVCVDGQHVEAIIPARDTRTTSDELLIDWMLIVDCCDGGCYIHGDQAFPGHIRFWVSSLDTVQNTYEQQQQQ